MATYQYSVFGVDLSKLQKECVAAGLPVDAVNGGAIGSPDVYILTSRPLTIGEKGVLDNLVAAHDGRPRRPRTLLTLYQAVNALSAGQKSDVAVDLFGPSNRWADDVGLNRGALFVLYTLTQLGLSAGQTATAKVAAAALYCQDNPLYLVSPAFSPTVNIPGDEVIPAPVLGRAKP